MRKIFIALSIILNINNYSCEQSDIISEDYMIPDIEEKIEKLRTMKIFFSHQSVGENIIVGLNSLSSNDHKINIVENLSSENLTGSYLYHKKIGNNEDPKSKCDEFRSTIEKLSDRIDIALMKFCYIDINRNSDVAFHFEYYKSTMDTLMNNYPKIKFLHTTSPLRYNDKGIGVWIREVLGRPNNSKLDNVKRNDFNNLLKQYYLKENIFDLAKAQSTYLNGRREYFEMNGNTYYSLIKEYTNDGGHLNELGSKIVAVELINILVETLQKDIQ